MLNEAKTSPYAAAHQSFGGVTKTMREGGLSSAPLDTIKFIREILFNLDVISEEELQAVKSAKGFTGKKQAMLAVLKANQETINAKTDEIAQTVESTLDDFISGMGVNRSREEKYAAQAASQEIAAEVRKAKSGKEMDDALVDIVSDEKLLVKASLAKAIQELEDLPGGEDLSPEVINNIKEFAPKINTIDQFEAFVKQMGAMEEYQIPAYHLSGTVKAIKGGLEDIEMEDQEDPDDLQSRVDAALEKGDIDRRDALDITRDLRNGEDGEDDALMTYLVDMFKQEYGSNPNEFENFKEDIGEAIDQKREYDLTNVQDVLAQAIKAKMDMGLEIEEAKESLKDDVLSGSFDSVLASEDGEQLESIELGGKLYEIGNDDPNDDGLVIKIEKHPNGYFITGGVYSEPEDFVNDPENPREGYGYALTLDGQPMDEDDLEDGLGHSEDNERKVHSFHTETDSCEACSDPDCQGCDGDEDAETRLGATNEFPDGEGKYEVVSIGGMHGQSKMGGEKFNSLADACAHAGCDPSEITSEEWIDMEGDGTTLEFMVDEDTAIVMHKNVPAEDAEGSVKQEVLAACKEHAGEFAHKAAGMAQACQEMHKEYTQMYEEYGKDGDQEKAEIFQKKMEIANNLAQYFATQAKHEKLTLESVYEKMGYIKAPVMDENGITSQACSTQKYLTEAAAQSMEENYTAQYLTEQKEKDSYKKSPKAKAVSFKERFQPKTQSQLEELRRYGL